MRRVWIEIASPTTATTNSLWSPSTRRVWIEMLPLVETPARRPRHPPRGGCGLKFRRVQLHHVPPRHPPRGGCGLKYSQNGYGNGEEGSPSMRRVWIEMQNLALLVYVRWSPSMRRAWIEIRIVSRIPTRRHSHPPCGGCGLKLPTLWPADRTTPGHPPCGGCGLKYLHEGRCRLWLLRHPPCGGCGLRRNSASIPPYPSHSPHKLLAMIPYLAL